MIVFDTSAIFALLLPSHRNHQWAKELFTGNEAAHTTTLCRYEFANILIKELRFNGMDTGSLASLLQAYHLLELEEHAIDFDPASIEWAGLKELSAYDAGFVLLAKKMNAPLATLDLKLMRKIQDAVTVLSP